MKIETKTIIKSSWGYDQTNIDFYEVVKVSNGWATLQEVGFTITEQAGFLAEYVIPVPEIKIGKPFRRKIKTYSSGDYVNISSYAGGSIWEGKPVLQTHYH